MGYCWCAISRETPLLSRRAGTMTLMIRAIDLAFNCSLPMKEYGNCNKRDTLKKDRFLVAEYRSCNRVAHDHTNYIKKL